MVGTRLFLANTDGPPGLGPLASKGRKGIVPVCQGCMSIRYGLGEPHICSLGERESLSVEMRSGDSEVCPKVTICQKDLALGFAVDVLLSEMWLAWEGAVVVEEGASDQEGP